MRIGPTAKQAALQERNTLRRLYREELRRQFEAALNGHNGDKLRRLLDELKACNDDDAIVRVVFRATWLRFMGKKWLTDFKSWLTRETERVKALTGREGDPIQLGTPEDEPDDAYWTCSRLLDRYAEYNPEGQQKGPGIMLKLEIVDADSLRQARRIIDTLEEADVFGAGAAPAATEAAPAKGAGKGKGKGTSPPPPPPPAEEEDPFGEDAETEREWDQKTVTEACQKYGRKLGGDKAKEWLKSFGISKFSEMKPEHYGKVMADLIAKGEYKE